MFNTFRLQVFSLKEKNVQNDFFIDFSQRLLQHRHSVKDFV